jgi:hypothetical protein
MPSDVALRCKCGSVRGVARGVSGDRGNRIVCYCDDCQSFAYFLEAAERVLDEHGGSDIFQTSPARVEITQGRDRLACMRLTPGGLHRWYADCCKTPIGNTLGTPQIAFIGLILSFADLDSLDRSPDETFGPVLARVNGRSAKGDRARLDAHDGASVSMILRFIRVFAAARLRGDHKRSPFFDPGTGKPILDARVLTPEELECVESLRDSS